MDASADLPKGSRRIGIGKWLAMASVALAMLGVLAGGTTLLHLRAADVPVVERAPLPVETLRAQREQGYAIEERFVGRLEPARETELAFERGGLVVEVLAEEGDRVVAGAAIVRLDRASLEAERDRLEAERNALLADRELAQITEERQRDLSAKGHSSVQRYDEARLATRALEARIGEIDAAIAGVDIDLRKSEVIAPFAGTIAARMVDEGAVVAAGSPLVRLLESDRPRARIGLSPEAAATLDPASSYSLEAEDVVLKASLVAIREDLATATRTVPVLFDIEDAGQVRFGDLVELVVRREVGTSGFWLPRAALNEGQRGLWDVLVVVETADGSEIARETVEILHVERDRVFVRGTLADQAVVISGPHRVIPGQKVVAIATETA
ncbi:MAG: efflux RND transporter periplasmic adaptor subunit, partial [Pseudomonadota bacterium]